MDFITALDPRKLQWEQGQGESVAHIVPGSPNTTLNRAAIPDQAAQDILNCNTDNGVWELDQRYRQFAPTPTTITDTVLVSHAEPCYMLRSHNGGTDIHHCGGGDVSGFNCTDGWGYNGGAGASCQSTTS